MSTPFKDYYSVLRISPSVSQVDIESAYRVMVKINHPDRFSETKKIETVANKIMQEVTEAYEVLKDINKKRRYDIEYDRNIRHKAVSEDPVEDESLRKAEKTILKKLNNGDRFAFVKDPKKIFVFMSGEEGVGWIVNSGGPNILLKSEVGDEQVFLWTGEETAPSGEAKQEQPTQEKEEPVEEEGWQTVGDMEIGDSFIEQGGKTRMTMIGIYPQYDFYFWVDADNQPHVSEISRVKDVKVKKIGAYKVERAKELAKIHKDYLQALVQEKLGRQ